MPKLLGLTLWDQHVLNWQHCTRCPLHTQRYRDVVLYRGKIPCRMLMVGEAPGSSENILGEPFKGPAGHLLDKIVAGAIAGTHPDMRIGFANIVGCFPAEAKETPDHRPPIEAVVACRPRIAEVVAMAQPEIIVCVGGFADTYLPSALAAGTTLYAGGKVEGHPTIHRWCSIQHPASILRKPSVAWDDLANQCVRTIAFAIAHL